MHTVFIHLSSQEGERDHHIYGSGTGKKKSSLVFMEFEGIGTIRSSGSVALYLSYGVHYSGDLEFIRFSLFSPFWKENKILLGFYHLLLRLQGEIMNKTVSVVSSLDPVASEGRRRQRRNNSRDFVVDGGSVIISRRQHSIESQILIVLPSSHYL